MYDWPEIRRETDAFWTALRDRLNSSAIDAPASLDRTVAAADGWRDPALLFSQTCGLPYASSLTGHVTLLGRPTYSAPGCKPGSYSSAIVARRSEPRTMIGDFRDSTIACNSETSQSGWAALEDMLPDQATLPEWSGDLPVTGSHRQSIQAVAAGEADIAAIDCVSWALAMRYEPAAAALKTVVWSATYPCLPFITASSTPAADADILKQALRDTVSGLSGDVRDALMLASVEDATPTDYAALKRPLRAA